MKKDKKLETAAEEAVEIVEVEEIDEVGTEQAAAKGKKERSADMIRRLRHGRIATLITIGVIVFALLFNVVFSILGDRFPLTLDLTKNNQFSLTDESVAIAKSLTRPVQIIVFASEETFSNIQSTDSYMAHQGQTALASILSEFYNATKQYNTLTDGKVTVTYIDMNTNPTAVSLYSVHKDDGSIENGDILFISDKQSRVVNVTDLASINVTDYNAAMSGTGGYGYDSLVEQTLATNLKAVQSENPSVITFATGYEEDSSAIEGLQNLYNLNGYDVESVNITRGAEINPNTVCLVIPAPSQKYTDESVERLRTWLHNDGKEGRNLMVFIDPSAPVEGNKLYDFLKTDYHLEVSDKLVYETNPNYTSGYGENYLVFGEVAVSEEYTQSCYGGEVYAGQTRQIIPLLDPESDDNAVEYSVNLVTFSEDAKLVTSTDSTAEPTDYNGTIVGMAVSVMDGFQNATQERAITKVAVCGSAQITYSANTVLATNQNESLLLDSMVGMSGVTNTVNISAKSLVEDTVTFSVGAQLIIGLGLFTIVLPLTLLIIGLVVFLRRRHL